MNEDSKKRVQYAYDHKFQIGSHTWSHRDLNTLDQDDSKLWL